MKIQDTWREAEKAETPWKRRFAALLSGAEIPGSPELVAWSRKFGWANGFEPLDRVYGDGTSTSGWVGTSSKGRYRLSEKAREIVNGELADTGPEQMPQDGIQQRLLAGESLPGGPALKEWASEFSVEYGFCPLQSQETGEPSLGLFPEGLHSLTKPARTVLRRTPFVAPTPENGENLQEQVWVGGNALWEWAGEFKQRFGVNPLDAMYQGDWSRTRHDGGEFAGDSRDVVYRLSAEAIELLRTEWGSNPSTETTPETGEVERFSTLHLLCRAAATAVDKVQDGLNRLENRVTADVEARIRAQEEQKKLQAELEGITQEHVALLEKYKDLQSRYEVLTSAAKGVADVHSHFRRQTLKVGWLCKRLLRQIFGPVTYLENDDADHHS